jgi:hypothetical protein
MHSFYRIALGLRNQPYAANRQETSANPPRIQSVRLHAGMIRPAFISSPLSSPGEGVHDDRAANRGQILLHRRRCEQDTDHQREHCKHQLAVRA